MGQGLSDQQGRAIVFIGETLIEYRGRVEAARAAGREDTWIGEFHLAWGARWRSGARDASGRASWSRSLRRLEARGLVLRRNWRTGPELSEPYRPPARTTSVTLTPAGWEAFRRLTGKDVPPFDP
jgi:hypothetical protein